MEGKKSGYNHSLILIIITGEFNPIRINIPQPRMIIIPVHLTIQMTMTRTATTPAITTEDLLTV